MDGGGINKLLDVCYTFDKFFYVFQGTIITRGNIVPAILVFFAKSLMPSPIRFDIFVLASIKFKYPSAL